MSHINLKRKIFQIEQEVEDVRERLEYMVRLLQDMKFDESLLDGVEDEENSRKQIDDEKAVKRLKEDLKQNEDDNQFHTNRKTQEKDWIKEAREKGGFFYSGENTREENK